jgi:hypothetical protein
MKEKRYKYITEKGGAWTGVFKTVAEAEKWFRRNGKFWEQRGFILKLVVTDEQ